MNGLPPDFPDGLPDPRDRSQQAARFLDLTKRHQEMISAGQDDLVAALGESDLDGDGAPDVLTRNAEITGEIVGRAFALDDDGDVFGDGNGFGRGGLDTDPFD